MARSTCERPRSSFASDDRPTIGEPPKAHGCRYDGELDQTHDHRGARSHRIVVLLEGGLVCGNGYDARRTGWSTQEDCRWVDGKGLHEGKTERNSQSRRNQRQVYMAELLPWIGAET